MSIGAQASKRLQKYVGQDSHSKGALALETAKHIQLQNVPRMAVPADIRRTVLRTDLRGVTDIAIDYDRFLPSGRALITLKGPDFLRDNLRALERLTIAGFPVQSASVKIEDRSVPARTRGVKGRADAINRGVITGNGPHAGITNCEKNVVIKGLPGKCTTHALENALKGFKLARLGKDRASIVKVPLPDNEFSMFSRFLVTLESEAEAHRLVRELHLTFYDEERYGKGHQLHVRAVY